MSETGLPKPGPSPSLTYKSIASLFLRLIGVIVILTAILFGLAGRLDWPQAWMFILAFCGFLLYYGAWALRNDPGQLRERSQVG